MNTGHAGNRIHLTNWSRYALHGPEHGWADALTIMVRPRSWEHGAGRVPLLMPAEADLVALRRRELSTDEYRARFERALGERLGVGLLSPGVLTAIMTTGEVPPVPDWSTLCCACGVGKPCHRVWAAPFLQRAGWSVYLDGEPYRADRTQGDLFG